MHNEYKQMWEIQLLWFKSCEQIQICTKFAPKILPGK